MKESVNRVQAITGFCLLLLAILGAWASSVQQYRQDGIDFSNHEERIKRLEDEKKDIIRYIEKVEGKVDRLDEKSSAILIMLQNKQDRK